MSELRVVAERTVRGAAKRVYRCIADFDSHHPRFLLPSPAVPAAGVVAVPGGAGRCGGRYGAQLPDDRRRPARAFRMRVETRWQGAGGSADSSSGCPRRGCCGGCTPTSWSGWTPPPARCRLAEPSPKRGTTTGRTPRGQRCRNMLWREFVRCMAGTVLFTLLRLVTMLADVVSRLGRGTSAPGCRTGAGRRPG